MSEARAREGHVSGAQRTLRETPPRAVRYWLASLLLVVAGFGALRTFQGIMSSELPKDFVQYWAVGRLLLAGENPYDPALQLREERQVYPDRETALMMWNPPPALPLYAPWGLLAPKPAALLWNGGQLLGILMASYLLVRIYAEGQSWWLFLPMSLGFAGTVWLLFYGQNTGWILLGLAGFLWGQQRNRPWLAGCFGALTVLKPHLLLGFGLVWLADWCYCGRPRTALLAGVITVLLATALAHIGDPWVVQHYLIALREPSSFVILPKDWVLPAASYWLRLYMAPQSMMVQFLPSILVSLAMLVWRVWCGKRWSWTQRLPVLIAVSFLTTGYGGWIFDLPVLLVPLIALAARMMREKPILLVYLTLWQFLITWATLAFAAGLHAFWWVAPATLLPTLFLPFLRPAPASSHAVQPLPSHFGDQSQFAPERDSSRCPW